MTSFQRHILIQFASICLFYSISTAGTPGFTGTWTIDRTVSSAIDPWSLILLDISVEGGDVAIKRTVSAGKRHSSQEYPLQIGKTVSVPVKWWTGNRHIGAYMGGDMAETIDTAWLDDGKVLKVESRYVLKTSQGETPVRSYYEYRLSSDGNELTVIELRSSRNRPIVHVFRRS